MLDIDGHAMQQIQVVLDPVYKKLQMGGMARKNCDRLLTLLRKGASDPTASKGSNSIVAVLNTVSPVGAATDINAC